MNPTLRGKHWGFALVLSLLLRRGDVGSGIGCRREVSDQVGDADAGLGSATTKGRERQPMSQQQVVRRQHRESEVGEEVFEVDAELFVTPVNAGPDFWFASHAGAAHAGED